MVHRLSKCWNKLIQYLKLRLHPKSRASLPFNYLIENLKFVNFMVSFAAAGTQCTVFSIRYMQMCEFENRAKFQNMNRQGCRQSGSKRPPVTKRRSRLVGEQTLTAHRAGSTELAWRWGFRLPPGQWSATASAGWEHKTPDAPPTPLNAPAPWAAPPPPSSVLKMGDVM